MKCKYCGQETLYLKQRSFETDDIMQANQVAVMCSNCGKFVKWCSKSERSDYSPTEPVSCQEDPKEAVKEQPAKKVSAQAKESVKPETVSKTDVYAIVDKVLARSARLLSVPTIRSVEARAMLNGIRDEIAKL